MSGTIYQLPVRSDLEAYSFTIALDGANYRLGFRWNTRVGIWLFDVSDTTGNGIVLGTPVQASLDLLARFVDPRLPPGAFLSYDTTGAGRDPARDNLGGDVLLLYQAVNS